MRSKGMGTLCGVVAALWIVTIVNAVVLAVGLIRLGVRWQVGSRFAWVATPLLLLNPLLASSIGLETMMAATLFVLLLECAVAGDGRRFGWLAGIGLLLRADLALIAGVRVFISAGRADPIVAPENTERLAELLKSSGADVTLRWTRGGQPEH